MVLPRVPENMPMAFSCGRQLTVTRAKTMPPMPRPPGGPEPHFEVEIICSPASRSQKFTVALFDLALNHWLN